MGFGRPVEVRPTPFLPSYPVRWLTLFILFGVARSERQQQQQQQQQQQHSYDVGRYRAPKSCADRPSHCTSNQTQQEPWTCKEEECSSRKLANVIPSDSKAANVATTNLTASLYYCNNNITAGCQHALNLTWTTTISNDAVGFLLRVTRHGPSKGVFNRTTEFAFWIDRNRFPNEREREMQMATFYSDCLRLAVASSYRFGLFSLHSVPNSDNITSQAMGETSLVTDCDTYPEADPALGKWAAYTTVTLSDWNSTANVYFTPAPHSFGFTSYDLSISRNGSNRILARTSNVTFTCTNIGVVVVKNICSGNYTVKVNAFGGHCPCDYYCTLCLRSWHFDVQGSNYSRCPINDMIIEVPSRVVNGPATPFRIPAENGSSSSAAVDVQESKSSNTPPNFYGLAIATCVVVVFVVAVGIVVFKKQQGKHSSHIKGVVSEVNDIEENVPVEKSIDKKVVLLVYAKDNAHHCHVVRCFATYLQRRCYCDVKFDLWSTDEISEISALDWLLRHIQTVDNVVLVNSEAGWRQYEADASNSAGFRPIRAGGDTGPIEDTFLPALRELRRGCYYYHSPPPRHRVRVFKVAFPYTRPEHCVSDIHPGRTYRLMDHVEDLFLNIHGLSKHGRNGRTTTAVDINGVDYARCPDGQRLQATVAGAVEYFRANPHWFSAFYRRKTEPILLSSSSSSPPPPSSSSYSSICESSESRKRRFASSDLDLDDLESGTGTLFNVPPSLVFVPPSLDSGTGGDDDDYDSASAVSLKLATTIELLNEDYDKMID